MSQFKEIQEKFFSETGICAVNSQGEPDIDYVNWLEKMVEEKFTSTNTSSPKFCPKCLDFSRLFGHTEDARYCPYCGAKIRVGT